MHYRAANRRSAIVKNAGAAAAAPMRADPIARKLWPYRRPDVWPYPGRAAAALVGGA